MYKTWSLILFPWFQKFGSNQSKPEFTVDLRGGSVEWASKDKSSKKHVIEVRDTVDLLSCFTVEQFWWGGFGKKVKLIFFFSSLSWRLVKGRSCWSSLRSTVSSTIGTEPSQRPSTHTWGDTFHSPNHEMSEQYTCLLPALPQFHFFSRTRVKASLAAEIAEYDWTTVQTRIYPPCSTGVFITAKINLLTPDHTNHSEKVNTCAAANLVWANGPSK